MFPCKIDSIIRNLSRESKPKSRLKGFAILSVEVTLQPNFLSTLSDSALNFEHGVEAFSPFFHALPVDYLHPEKSNYNNCFLTNAIYFPVK